jgi:hypothetical protein
VRFSARVERGNSVETPSTICKNNANIILRVILVVIEVLEECSIVDKLYHEIIVSLIEQ